MEGEKIDGRLFGTYMRKYAGKVWEISPEQFAKFDNYFISEEDENYQKRVEKAPVQAPTTELQKPSYGNQGGHEKIITVPGIAKY